MSLGNKAGHIGRRQTAWGTDGYVRPTEWIALPTVTAGEQKLVGLFRVNNAANNYVAVLCRGAYTVNWGDGSAPENVADNVQAKHLYNFADVAASTETDGGWRQAIITITPQAGAALTTVNLNCAYTGSPVYTQGWLDIKMAGTAVASLAIGGTVKPCTLLQRFEYVGGNVVTSFFAMFYGCSSLQSVPALDTSSGADFREMFRGCSSLQSVPALDTSSGADFAYMFSGTGKITSSSITGPRYTHSYATNLLPRAAIVTIFNNLGTAAAAGQSVTVSGNPGAALLDAADLAIATAKGWTVIA